MHFATAASLEAQLAAVEHTLELVAIPGEGRGVVAARAIEQGEVVHEEAPMLCTPPAHALGGACYRCLRPLAPPRAHPAAPTAPQFCGDACAAAAEREWWAAERAADFAGLQAACAAAGEKLPLLLARLACLRIQEQAAGPDGSGSSSGNGNGSSSTQAWAAGGGAVLRGDALADLRHLCYARIGETPPEWARSHALLLRGLEPLRRTTRWGRGLGDADWQDWLAATFSLRWYTDQLARLHVNVFRCDTVAQLDPNDPDALLRAAAASLGCSSGSAQQPPHHATGSAVYALASMFNHSCEPCLDVCFPHNNAVVALTAARDIAQGEQLKISYTDFSAPRAARQQQLSWAYGFECRCPRCLEEEGEGVRV